jgi:hypothetical protein
MEGFEGVVIRALGGVEAALEFVEGVARMVEGIAERNTRAGAGPDCCVLELPLPQLGFDLAQTAEEPIARDEGIDVGCLLGSGGLEALVVGLGECL